MNLLPLLVAMLQFGHGCDAVEIPCKAIAPRADDVSFNSATAVMPWRYSARWCGWRALNWLQFGHGCDAVEMCETLGAACKAVGLQFGHGCDAVEMPSRCPL